MVNPPCSSLNIIMLFLIQTWRRLGRSTRSGVLVTPIKPPKPSTSKLSNNSKSSNHSSKRWSVLTCTIVTCVVVFECTNIVSSQLDVEQDKLESYKTYLKREMEKNDDPSRVQCLFERAITDHCLKVDVWLRYGKYLVSLSFLWTIHMTSQSVEIVTWFVSKQDQQLKLPMLSIAMYERAVRNCPWSATLWSQYCCALERGRCDHDRIKGCKKNFACLRCSSMFVFVFRNVWASNKRRVSNACYRLSSAVDRLHCVHASPLLSRFR